MTSPEYDVVVVGAGVHGAAAAWQLGTRGDRVLQLERFAAGHVQGSSHGHTRMIRRAYPSPVWSELVEAAYAGWAELARATGRSFVTRTGGIYARPPGTEGGLAGRDCRTVDSAGARELAPGLALPADSVAVHDPSAGVIDAVGAMRALREVAAAAGVRREEGRTALGWECVDDGVVVRTATGPVRAGRLVLCAGPWTAGLVPTLAGRLRVTRIVNVHVGSSRPERLAPPWLGPFSVEVPGEGLLYGLPAWDGQAVKVGLDDGPPDDPERPPGPVTAAERTRLLDLARRYLPAADGPVVAEVACRYTMAPGNRFALGALPGAPRVLVAAACSGHGFKFGPAVGAALADLAHDVPRPDLTAFDPALMLA